MESPYTPKQTQRSKEAAIKDVAFWSVMVGGGEGFVTPFALALGASSQISGIISTLPQFIGAVAQLLSLPLDRHLRARKPFVAAGVLLQALVWVPMALLAHWAAPETVPLVLVLFCLHHIFGMAVSPPWSAWMADIVPENERAAYFSARNRVSVLVVLLSTAGGGWALAQSGWPPLAVFSGLFLLAFVARAASGFFLCRMEEERHSAPADGRTATVDWREFLSNPAFGEERLFALYILLLVTATNIASPFFDVYMLTRLKFDYLTWALVSLVAGPVARFVVLPYWGKMIDRFGNRAVLFATGLLVPSSPVMWLFTTDPALLFISQMSAGVAWSGFELSCFNYCISSKDRRLRTAQTASYNFAKGSGTFVGALLGGALIAAWPAQGALGWGPFLGVFAVSALLRYAVSFAILPRFSAKTFSEGVSGGDILWQMLAIQPAYGLGKRVMLISESGLHAAQAGAGATERAARKGLDFTIHMLRRGPLMIRMHKDKL